MSEWTDDQRAALRLAVLTDEDRGRLYKMSAEYHAVIAALPTILDAIGDECALLAEWVAAQVRIAERSLHSEVPAERARTPILDALIEPVLPRRAGTPPSVVAAQLRAERGMWEPPR